MEKLEDFINKFKFPYEGKYLDDIYTITLPDSDAFSDMYNLISNAVDIEMTQEATATIDNTVFIFTDGYYELKLEADYNDDIYKVTISRR